MSTKILANVTWVNYLLVEKSLSVLEIFTPSFPSLRVVGHFNDPTSIPKKFRYIVRTVRWNCSDQEKTTKQNVQLLQTGQNA